MCSDWQTASQGCAFFSATGIIFMVRWVCSMTKQNCIIYEQMDSRVVPTVFFWDGRLRVTLILESMQQIPTTVCIGVWDDRNGKCFFYKTNRLIVFLFSTHTPTYVQTNQSWIGIMLIKQPFFILGIEDVETAKGNAFGAAAIFLFTFLLSIFYQLNETRQLNFADLQSLSSQPGRGSIGRFGEYSNIVLRDHSDSGQGHEDEDPFVTTTLQRSDSGVSLSRRRTNGNTPTGIIVWHYCLLDTSDNFVTSIYPSGFLLAL